jgi:Domain of unknown function (DUF4384)
MLPNKSIMGWCLGVLVVSVGGAEAKSSAIGPTKIGPAEIASFESFVTSTFSSASSTLSPVPPVPFAIRIAQNASDRNNAIPNAAKVSLQMSPDRSVGVGTKISFRITSKKPGYLMLIDIDADGKMSQIFPSPEMIVQSQEAATNFIKPGEELLIPNSAAKKHGFEYVITPPLGTAAVVAILSDRRVQILDLPDNAQKQRTEAETINYLTGWMNGLRVPDPGTGKLQPSNWSFDIKPYLIK